jgi:HEPN domain-containing protein
VAADRVIGALLRIAKDDLDDAVQLGGRRNAAYLLEQAAEKVIRAVLTSENIHGGVGHRLQELVAKLPDENPLKAKLQAVVRLEDYATSFRYGTPAGRIQDPPPPDEMNSYVSSVRNCLTEAARRFDVDLAEDRPTARRPQPLR